MFLGHFKHNCTTLEVALIPSGASDCIGLGWRLSLKSRELSRVFSKPQFESINSSALSFLHSPTLTFIHGQRKNHSLDKMDLCWQVMFLLFNMLSRLVITFLPSSKHLLISWLQSPSAVINHKIIPCSI